MRWILLLICSCLLSCEAHKSPEPVTFVTGSWYGFYPLYYAQEHNIDEQFGLRFKIVEPTNVSNLRRSYLQEQVQFAATSMLEFTNATYLTGLQLKPLIITDFSNGGDVIITTKSIDTLAQLRNKNIAVPSKGIGEYILSLVFDDTAPKHHYQQVKLSETLCGEAFSKGEIDACVTYPPISTQLLRDPNLKVLYTTAKHPKKIFDLIWAKPYVSAQTREQVQQVWAATLEKISRDPAAFHQFIAKTTGVSVASVEQAMAGIELVSNATVVNDPAVQRRLTDNLIRACLVASGNQCEQYHSLFEGWH